jgi:hypothetical protein
VPDPVNTGDDLPLEAASLEIFIRDLGRADPNAIHMDTKSAERMLLVWLKSSQQGIHDVRKVV